MATQQQQGDGVGVIGERGGTQDTYLGPAKKKGNSAADGKVFYEVFCENRMAEESAAGAQGCTANAAQLRFGLASALE